MMRRRKVFHAICPMAMVFLFVTLPPLHAEQRSQDFSADPGWEGRNNRLPVTFPPRMMQDFGYYVTNHAGKEAGEIGGYFQSTVRPAYYGKPIGPLTLDDPLEFSGTFALLEGRSISQWITGVSAYIGFFNSREQGWRARNFLGFRFMGFNEPDGCTIEVYYGTGDGAAGGMFLARGGEIADGSISKWDESAMLRIAPDGKPHHWRLTYDPAAGGTGIITFSLDDTLWKVEIRSDHRQRGAEFNRFGIFNEQVPGRAMTVYFDDMTINGLSEDFSSDPVWEASENGDILRTSGDRDATVPVSRVRRIFHDSVLYGSNDFGLSPTNHAGGQPGEIGGRFWRVEEQEYVGYFADDVGALTLDDRLEAHGKIAIPVFAIDSGVHIGWFNHETMGRQPPSEVIGVELDSFTQGGRFFMPMYGARRNGGTRHPLESPFFAPGPKVMSFSILYDPLASDGHGRVTVTLDDQSASIDLPAEARREGALLDRFGIFSMFRGNGKYCELYLDDLTYTVDK